MTETIATAGQAWRQMEEELRLIHDLIGGTATMRRAGARWLPREDGESWSAWRARVHRSVLFNGVGRLVQVLSGNPFRKDVLLQDAHESLQKIAQNMDGHNMSLTAFLRHLLYAMLCDGMVHIQIESPKSGGQPYFIIRRAQDVIGAVSDAAGGLGEVRLQDSLIRKTGRYQEAVLNRIHLYSDHHWELWHEQDAAKGKWHKADEGTHDLGQVPLVPIIANPTGFMTARPPLIDMAWLNLAHWQSASDQRHILHVARVPILFGRGLQMAERGLGVDEVNLLFENDIDIASQALDIWLAGWRDFSPSRKSALLSMAFNLGAPRLCQFVKLRSALIAGDFDTAAAEALDSKWARQVGGRADEIAALIAKG